MTIKPPELELDSGVLEKNIFKTSLEIGNINIPAKNKTAKPRAMLDNCEVTPAASQTSPETNRTRSTSNVGVTEFVLAYI